MREYLRRTADEGWIIDLTPEGHQPSMSTRFFRGNQQPICVAVFIRRSAPSPDAPAQVHRLVVHGTVDQKADALRSLRPDGPEWLDCTTGWPDPFQPATRGSWNTMPTTVDLMPWTSPGVKPNRTWVYSPDRRTLEARWRTLASSDESKKSTLFHESRDATLYRKGRPLPGFPSPSSPFSDEHGNMPAPLRVGYRSFDRQWLIPDSRLIATPRPALWTTLGDEQIFAAEQHAQVISDGPALTFSSLIPDMDYFMGHHGGRVIPLHREGATTAVNAAPGLLRFLANELMTRVIALDLVAYLAAVCAHPGYVQRFSSDLLRPGIRIPLTADAVLWTEAVAIGREVLWLHTYGERCADVEADRPPGPPRMRKERPTVRVAIPDTEDGMPAVITYDDANLTLHVGDGEIAPVAPEVWAYQVSGMRVLNHWFGYRKKNPAGKRTSPLDDIVAKRWTATMTTELLELLNVLGRCVALEPRQDELLSRIVDGPLITVEDMSAAGVLPVPTSARRPPRPHTADAHLPDA